ncbi:acetyltransferase [Fulvivirga sedimenti]|uniref:Acetyltransferase n=1 Tax=Fulvivirga sedimenti TaxID=2879465 RepID=A0A9X1HNF6_9BACT|nr:acetyltransferase [Fulvivirga sedimenti]MCA6073409.1 acetyltransferase [Fulvivirga sedimenti]
MMNNRPLYIYGAGGLGKEVAALIFEINRVTPQWDLRGFFDDAWPEKKVCYDLPVIGDLDALLNLQDKIALVVAIGNPVVKRDVILGMAARDIEFPTLIHPNVVRYDRERIHIGDGSVVGAGVTMTTDIKIGHHVLINLHTTIGHDCEIGDFSAIMPGVNLAGGVTVGKSVFIGSGANLVNAVNIGEEARIGAGAVVLRDVYAGKTVVGVPAHER